MPESSKYNCPECKDTRIYQGLNAVEPCRACDGKRQGIPPLNLTASTEGFECGLTQAHLFVTKNSGLEFEQETTEIDKGHWIEYRTTGYRTVYLKRLGYDPLEMPAICDAINHSKRILLLVQMPNGDQTPLKGIVQSLLFYPESMEVDVVLLQGPADA